MQLLKESLTFVCIVFFNFLIGIFIYGLIMARYNTASTQGTVIETKNRSRSGCFAKVRYVVDDIKYEYEASITYHQYWTYKVGSQITVYYNPKNPKVVVTNKPNPLLLDVFVLILVIFIFLIDWIIIFVP